MFMLILVNNKLPVYRHLAKQKWLKRPIAILNQRLTTLKVIPDAIPKLAPTVQVELEGIEPGAIVEPSHPIKINIHTFSPHVKLFSLIMLDLDAPPSQHPICRALHCSQPDRPQYLFWLQ